MGKKCNQVMRRWLQLRLQENYKGRQIAAFDKTCSFWGLFSASEADLRITGGKQGSGTKLDLRRIWSLFLCFRYCILFSACCDLSLVSEHPPASHGRGRCTRVTASGYGQVHWKMHSAKAQQLQTEETSSNPLWT